MLTILFNQPSGPRSITVGGQVQVDVIISAGAIVSGEFHEAPPRRDPRLEQTGDASGRVTVVIRPPPSNKPKRQRKVPDRRPKPRSCTVGGRISVEHEIDAGPRTGRATTVGCSILAVSKLAGGAKTARATTLGVSIRVDTIVAAKAKTIKNPTMDEMMVALKLLRIA